MIAPRDFERVHESRDVTDTGIQFAFPAECAAVLGGNELVLHIIENSDEQGDWIYDYDLQVNGERLMVLAERRAAQAHERVLSSVGGRGSARQPEFARNELIIIP